MFDTQPEFPSKHGANEHLTIFEEYIDVTESLKRELHLCKVEQNNIRTELFCLQTDNQNAKEVQEAFAKIHSEECCRQDILKEELTNLNERITVLQAEKESAIQLWQLSLKTIHSLEEELQANVVNNKGAKFYQEQTNNVKAIYSEAIAALENKLSQAKENILKQQAICQTNKERLDDVTNERNDVVQKLAALQKETEERDRNNLVSIETLKKDLAYAKAETKKVSQMKSELEKKLDDMKKFTDGIIERDKETKMKMAEALELIESAVREKDIVLHREALILDEKARLESRLNTIANEYDAKIQELSDKNRNEYERNLKAYLSEINDLKFQLREKSIKLENCERDLKLAEEEQLKIRNNLDEMLEKTSTKMLDHEQKLKEMKNQLHSQDILKNQDKSDPNDTYFRNRIEDLESKLRVSNDKLRQLEHQASVSLNDRAKHADRKSAEIFEHYINLESQLARTLGDKEEVVLKLKSLKHDFDYEIQKRDNDRHFLENRIRELELNLQKANSSREAKSQTRTADPCKENKSHCCQVTLSEQINKLQEKFDKKTKELVHHVQVHQRLSKRWRDEARSLTTRFQVKSKELKLKINTLQKENNDLSKELLVCKQEIAKYKMQEIQRYNEPYELR